MRLGIFKWSCSLWFMIIHVCLWLVVGSGTILVYSVVGWIEYHSGTRYMIVLDTTPRMTLTVLFGFCERNKVCDNGSMTGPRFALWLYGIYFMHWLIHDIWLYVVGNCWYVHYYVLLFCGELFTLTIMDWPSDPISTQLFLYYCYTLFLSCWV